MNYRILLATGADYAAAMGTHPATWPSARPHTGWKPSLKARRNPAPIEEQRRCMRGMRAKLRNRN